MPDWELATRENWELILSESRIIQKEDPTKFEYLYEYTPIQPIYATLHSHILLIGTQSNSALNHWFLGARASQYLYVSPSMTSAFISGVQASDTKKCGLNRLTLVEFKNYDVVPYILQLEIPYWLEDVYVEVWEYQGHIGGSQLEFDASDIIERLQRIESKISTDNNDPYTYR